MSLHIVKKEVLVTFGTVLTRRGLIAKSLAVYLRGGGTNDRWHMIEISNLSYSRKYSKIRHDE